MKRHEVNTLIRNLDKSYASTLSPKEKTIIAVYHNNYDQRQNITLEDDLEHVSSDVLALYGIISPSFRKSSFSRRKYLVFFDNPAVFESTATLREYYQDYCQRYLPKNVEPDEFAFKFVVDNFEQYKEYVALITEINDTLCPFYTFKSLIEGNALGAMLQGIRKQFEGEYEIFNYDISQHDRIMAFFKKSQVKEESYKNELIANMDQLAAMLKSFERPVMIHATYNPSDLMERGKVALVMAYLNFKYGIPIYSELSLEICILERLSHFYFPDNICTLHDKIQILCNYQQVGLLCKEFCRYFVYMPDEGRKISSRISFLHEGSVRGLQVDFEFLNTEDDYDSDAYLTEMQLLEERMGYNVFLHVGNTVRVTIPGVGKVVAYIHDLNVEFPGIMIPLISGFTPFQSQIDLHTLKQMVPIVGCKFKSIGDSLDPLTLFRETLGALKSKGAIKLEGAIRAKPYVPSLFQSGEAMIHYYLYIHLKDKYQFIGDNQRIISLCSYQNVVFRNELIIELMEIVSLQRLRNIDYLTMYGTNFTQLQVSEELFKTRR